MKESFTVTEFDAHVIYGFEAGLKQWHVFAIVPVNGTLKQVDNLIQINKNAITMATGKDARCLYLPKNMEAPLWIGDSLP